MAFSLDLALVYACALVLCYWVAAWLVPALAQALLVALRSLGRRLEARLSGGRRVPPSYLPDVRVRPLF